MKDLAKYRGIIPAFYACYDENGGISVERTRLLIRNLISKGVQGVYVCGSSGECIYLNKDERKLILETVMTEAKDKITVIAHVACNNTEDSMELAAHAQQLEVDAIAAIPPIYFKLPERSIAKYWNDISSAAPNTDFIIYNIPQLAGVALTPSLFKIMLENPQVIGVKNSSMPVQDIQIFKDAYEKSGVVFNGPDEQLAGGLALGADGGIGGTYGAMPELYIGIYKAFMEGNREKALKIQYQANRIIKELCSCYGNIYAVLKEVIRLRDGIDLGGVRAPLLNIIPEDEENIKKCVKMIDEAINSLKGE